MTIRFGAFALDLDSDKLADLKRKTNTPLTRRANRGALRTFDISRDGKHIVFARSHQNSDIHLIELVR